MITRRSRRSVGGSAPIRALVFAFGLAASAAFAQTASAPPASDAAALETLVGPVALYPDDLLSIVLPASTFPLQIVEADRWLQQNKGKKDAKPNESWDDSVKALLNYPEVLTKMSADLEWTGALGDAVATDQTAVMDSVQSFRRKASGAGNLKSDDKQTVVVEKEVVQIVQTDPQVIYVPQYEPTTVIVQQAAPVYPSYYPEPYPSYYYPYPPGAALATGIIWGATMAYAFDWHGGGIHNDIDIDRNTNINRNTNVSNRPTSINQGRSQQMAQSKRGTWQAKQGAGTGRPSASQQGRVGDRAGSGAGATSRAQGGAGGVASRAGTSSAGAAANRSGSQARPSTGSMQSRSAGGASAGASARRASGSAGGSRYGSASSYSRSPNSGRSASAQSSRGMSSRSSMGGSRGGGGRRR